MQNLKAILSSLIILLMVTSCGNNAGVKQDNATSETTLNASQLGDITFNVTGADEAQPAFEKGLLLLHSFEYEDARTAFLKVQEIDSTFAMAYWGEAMTYNHTLWQRQEIEAARAALNKLAPNAADRSLLVKTEMEKDFFQAIELLLGEGTKYDRDIAYKNFMETLTKKYPNQHEVSAFYAVSLLGSSRNGRDEALYGKCAKIVQGIIKENPKHPGALHYLIHSFDDPGHAHLAKAAADSYSKTAPDAAHALHMPSHIYVALGKWNEVIHSNIASWNASVKRMKRKGLETDALSYHALNWLQYGLLQRGEKQQATQMMKLMKQYDDSTQTKASKSYLISMKGGHMIETNSWDDAIANMVIDTENLNLTKRAGYAFLEGMKNYHQKNPKQLSKIIKGMEVDRNKSMLELGDKAFAMCSAGGYANKPASQLDIDMVHVMEMELKALRASLLGDNKKAMEYFEKASALDDGLTYSYGPPVILKPVHEAYGEWLLQQDQATAALAVFEKSLKRHPRRLLSLKGQKAAAAMVNDSDALAKAEQELELSTSPRKREEML